MNDFGDDPDVEVDDELPLLWAGDCLDSGRILLFPNGKAVALPSIQAEVAGLRSGRFRSPLPDSFLIAARVLALGNEADEATAIAMEAATSIEEGAKQFRLAQKAENEATDARVEAAIMLGAPLDVTSSSHEFQTWFLGTLRTPDELDLFAGIWRRAGEACRSDAARAMLQAIEKLVGLLGRPPTKKELREAMGVSSGDAKEHRETRKKIGFDWLL